MKMFFGYKYELVQGVYATPQTRISTKHLELMPLLKSVFAHFSAIL